MKFFFLGIIVGAAASLFLFTPTAGIEIYPEWHAGIHAVNNLDPSGKQYPEHTRFFVRAEQNYYLLQGNGRTAVSGNIADGLAAFSGNGAYYVKYQKVGSDIEFYNSRGDRFWKLESLEYPYLSYKGNLIFLLNGDHSSVRFIDNNGNEIGSKTVSGRTCTALSFSDHGDYGGIGFVDGSYHIINASGRVINQGSAPEGAMVKGIAESGNGRYAALHYGNSQKDNVRIIEISSGDHNDVALNHIHAVKTTLHITDDGYCTIFDVDKILYITDSGKIKYGITIPKKRPGHSAISFRKGIYAASYTTQNGSSMLYIFKENGVVLFSKEFPAESFLDAVIKSDLVFLRGSNNLFCYSINRREPE